MPKQQPKHVRKMVQHGSKFGPSWGHVGLQNRPGRVQGRKNASQRPLEKRIRKSIEKPRSGEAPRREMPGGWVVNLTVWGPKRKQFSFLHLIIKTSKLETSKLEASKPLKKLQAINLSFSWIVDLTLKLLLHSRLSFASIAWWPRRGRRISLNFGIRFPKFSLSASS